MGSLSSKTARAAGSAARQYPQRASAEATKAATPGTSSTNPTGPASNPTASQPGPTPYTSARPNEARDQAIDMDARDPQFASRLSELGPVKPYPTYSPSSRTGSAQTTTTAPTTPSRARTSADGPGGGSAGAPSVKSGVFPSPAANPAVAMLAARQRIAEEAEREKVAAGKKGFEGRSFVDVAMVRKILVLRDEQGMEAGEIERALGLRRGVVGGLGRRGLVEAA